MSTTIVPSSTASPTLQAAIALYNAGNYAGAWAVLATQAGDRYADRVRCDRGRRDARKNGRVAGLVASRRVRGLRRMKNEHGQNDGERTTIGEKNGAPSPCNSMVPM